MVRKGIKYLIELHIVKLFPLHCTILRDLALLHRDPDFFEDVRQFHAKAVSFQKLGIYQENGSPGLCCSFHLLQCFSIICLLLLTICAGFSPFFQAPISFSLPFPPYFCFFLLLTVLPDSLIFRIKYFPPIAYS